MLLAALDYLCLVEHTSVVAVKITQSQLYFWGQLPLIRRIFVKLAKTTHSDQYGTY